MRFEEMRMKMQKNEKEKETGLTNRIFTYFSYLGFAQIWSYLEFSSVIRGSEKVK